MKQQKILENKLSRKHRFVLRTLRQDDNYYSPRSSEQFKYTIDSINENKILSETDILDDKKGYIAAAYDAYVKTQTNDENYKPVEDMMSDDEYNYFSDGFVSSDDIDVDDFKLGADASNYKSDDDIFFSDDGFDYVTKTVDIEKPPPPVMKEEKQQGLVNSIFSRFYSSNDPEPAPVINDIVNCKVKVRMKRKVSIPSPQPSSDFNDLVSSDDGEDSVISNKKSKRRKLSPIKLKDKFDVSPSSIEKTQVKSDNQPKSIIEDFPTSTPELTRIMAIDDKDKKQSNNAIKNHINL